jgi:hypothetical protein
LREEIDTEKGISAFCFRLGRFSKEEVSGVEEKDSPPFFHLRDKSGFLGDTTKRVPESPTGFYLTHHIIGVDNTELGFGRSLEKRGIGKI